MSSAWRTAEGRTIVRCDACGSTGTTHVQVKVTVTPEAQAALDSQAVRGTAIHQKFESDWAALAAKIKGKQAAAPDEKGRTGFDEAEALLADYNEEVAKLGAEPLEGIGFLVEQCPWCKARIDAPLVMLKPGEQEPKAA
jgi:hypothetical protein